MGSSGVPVEVPQEAKDPLVPVYGRKRTETDANKPKPKLDQGPKSI